MPAIKQPEPGFLVLAAGRSLRFGHRCKLSARLPNGQRVLDQTLANIAAVSSRICIVLSANSSAKASLPHCRVVNYSGQSPGLGDSIRFGVESTRNWSGWIMCLADMPWIPSEIYQTVLENSGYEQIVAPCCDGRRGHPVYFPGRFYPQLTSLHGDCGAGSLISSNRQTLSLIETDCEAIHQDIDSPDDLLVTR